MKRGEAIATVTGDGDRWTARLPADWANERTVFGGLQAALLVRGMRGVLGALRVLPLPSLHVTFVSPVAAGQHVKLRPELLRTGKSAAHARCDMHTSDGIVCTAVAIFGADRPSSVVLEIPRLEAGADPETLQDWPYIPGVTPEFMRHLQLRLARGALPYTGQSEAHSTIFG